MFLHVSTRQRRYHPIAYCLLPIAYCPLLSYPLLLPHAHGLGNPLVQLVALPFQILWNQAHRT